jgi:hypothetical protein
MSEPSRLRKKMKDVMVCKSQRANSRLNTFLDVCTTHLYTKYVYSEICE